MLENIESDIKRIDRGLFYQLGGGQLLGHRHVHNGHLCVSGVGLCHAVAGAAALRDHGLNLYSLASLHWTEGKTLLLIVGSDLQEQESGGMEEKPESKPGKKNQPTQGSRLKMTGPNGKTCNYNAHLASLATAQYLATVFFTAHSFASI